MTLEHSFNENKHIKRNYSKFTSSETKKPVRYLLQRPSVDGLPVAWKVHDLEHKIYKRF